MPSSLTVLLSADAYGRDRKITALEWWIIYVRVWDVGVKGRATPAIPLLVPFPSRPPRHVQALLHKRFLAGCSTPSMRLAEHLAFRFAPVAQAIPAWSAETQLAASRHCRDARVYVHTTTAILDVEYILLPPYASRFSRMLLSRLG